MARLLIMTNKEIVGVNISDEVDINSSDEAVEAAYNAGVEIYGYVEDYAVCDKTKEYLYRNIWLEEKQVQFLQELLVKKINKIMSIDMYYICRSLFNSSFERPYDKDEIINDVGSFSSFTLICKSGYKFGRVTVSVDNDVISLREDGNLVCAI